MAPKEIIEYITLISVSSGLLYGLWQYLVMPLWKFTKSINQKSQVLSSALPQWVEAYYVSESYGKSLGTLLEEIYRQVHFNHARMRAIANSQGIAYFETDERGLCKYVSPQWCALAEITQEEARGHGWIIGIYPPDRERVQEEWREAVVEEREFDLTFKMAGGTLVHSHSMRVINEKGVIIGHLGALIPLDIHTK